MKLYLRVILVLVAAAKMRAKFTTAELRQTRLRKEARLADGVGLGKLTARGAAAAEGGGACERDEGVGGAFGGNVYEVGQLIGL